MSANAWKPNPIALFVLLRIPNVFQRLIKNSKVNGGFNFLYFSGNKNWFVCGCATSWTELHR